MWRAAPASLLKAHGLQHAEKPKQAIAGASAAQFAAMPKQEAAAASAATPPPEDAAARAAAARQASRAAAIAKGLQKRHMLFCMCLLFHF
jgi:hypothetical protein